MNHGQENIQGNGKKLQWEMLEMQQITLTATKQEAIKKVKMIVMED